jgi:hypothetical protein
MVKSFQFGSDGLLFYLEVSMGLESQGDEGVSLQFFMTKSMQGKFGNPPLPVVKSIVTDSN